MSRKERTKVRRTTYRAWKQQHAQSANAIAEAPLATAQQPETTSAEPSAKRGAVASTRVLPGTVIPFDPAAPGHSTGPRTEEGLARSSQNARKHGLSSLTSAFVMLPGEDPHEWVALMDDLRAEFRPVTRTEHILITDMAQSHWLTQRAINLQTRSVEDSKSLALYLRYQTTHHRAYYRALNQLLALQKARSQSSAKPTAAPSKPASPPTFAPEPSVATPPSAPDPALIEPTSIPQAA